MFITYGLFDKANGYSELTTKEWVIFAFLIFRLPKNSEKSYHKLTITSKKKFPNEIFFYHVETPFGHRSALGRATQEQDTENNSS